MGQEDGFDNNVLMSPNYVACLVPLQVHQLPGEHESRGEPGAQVPPRPPLPGGGPQRPLRLCDGQVEGELSRRPQQRHIQTPVQTSG